MGSAVVNGNAIQYAGCMTLPPPPLPPPEPVGGDPRLETAPGEDPWRRTRFVGEEKWWYRTWFRAVLVVVLLAAFVAVLEITL